MSKRITDQCRQLLRHIDTICPPSTLRSSPANLTRMKISLPPLPYPSPITATLLSLGATATFADLASLAYLRSALSIRRDCEHHIQHVSRVWVETTNRDQDISTQVNLIHTIFVSRYRQTLNSIIDQIFALVRSKLITSEFGESRKEKRNTFNKSVIPILEEFYSRNPFPTAQDRQGLARRTKLTLKQIHDWFQNRRARAKRAGQTPMRKPGSATFVACQPSTLPSTLETEINRLIDDEIHRFDSAERHLKENKDDIPSNNSLSSVLWPTETPEHAFPTPYRPDCEHSRPSVKDTLVNFDIPWIRETSRVQYTVQSSIPDLTVLERTFSNLSIDHDVSLFPVSESFSPIHSMWIPTKSSPLPPTLSPFATRRKDIRSPKRKLSAQSSLREASTLQTSTSNDASPRTQPYPRSKPQPSLPRRIPKSQPHLVGYRRRSSHSQSSRSSSVSSIASDDSFSSYASSSDSELGTPPPISTDLPIYLSEKDSSCSSPISLSKLSVALPKSPIAPRIYTFRTTIAPS